MLFDFSIDRGGTFTDIYCEITDQDKKTKFSKVMKLLSVDPQNYKDAPTEGIRRVLSEYAGSGEIGRDVKIPTAQIRSIRMGTTVATNALLERKGDRVALLISEGLRDTLEIGNQSRPKIFDLEIKKPLPVYERILEISERIRPVFSGEDISSTDGIIEGANGQKYVVLKKPDLAKVEQDLNALKAEGEITSLSIVLMHSYAFTEHETAIEELAKKVGFQQVSVSSKVMPRVKLVKRGQTCCVDAYLNPHIFRYLTGFVHGFDEHLMEKV